MMEFLEKGRGWWNFPHEIVSETRGEAKCNRFSLLDVKFPFAYVRRIEANVKVSSVRLNACRIYGALLMQLLLLEATCLQRLALLTILRARNSKWKFCYHTFKDGERCVNERLTIKMTISSFHFFFLHFPRN